MDHIGDIHRTDSAAAIALEDRWCAHNYQPLPVVISRGQGVWLWDSDGRRYLDMMSAYSAVNVGHAHPRLLRALSGQASRLAVISRKPLSKGRGIMYIPLAATSLRTYSPSSPSVAAKACRASLNA